MEITRVIDTGSGYGPRGTYKITMMVRLTDTVKPITYKVLCHAMRLVKCPERHELGAYVTEEKNPQIAFIYTPRYSADMEDTNILDSHQLLDKIRTVCDLVMENIPCAENLLENEPRFEAVFGDEYYVCESFVDRQQVYVLSASVRINKDNVKPKYASHLKDGEYAGRVTEAVTFVPGNAESITDEVLLNLKAKLLEKTNDCARQNEINYLVRGIHDGIWGKNLDNGTYEIYGSKYGEKIVLDAVLDERLLDTILNLTDDEKKDIINKLIEPPQPKRRLDPETAEENRALRLKKKEIDESISMMVNEIKHTKTF